METITKTENTALDSVLNESGLILTEAEEIKQSYLPFFEQMAEIKELAKKINFENPTELDEKIARELRLRTQKIRTGSEQVKDSRKKIHMLKANVEQGAWNLIKATCQLDEETFAQVEKARERKETARKAALKIEREGLIAEYCDDATLFNLGEISEDQFTSLFNGLKLAHVAKLEAELQAEKDRAAKEKAEAEEKARVKAENEKLKAENEAKEKLLKEQQAKAEKEKKALEAKAKAEKDKADAILAEQKKQAEEKAKKEKAIADAKLKEEREAKEKLESELKAKKEAEELAEKERLAELAKQEEIKAQAELMPDKEKLLDFANEVLPFLKLPDVKSAKAKKITANVRALLEKIQIYIQAETEKLK
jgi:colicin import membrane protein